MKTLLSAILATLLFISHNAIAEAIYKCTQPDGIVEFTNKDCAKSNQFQSKLSYSRN